MIGEERGTRDLLHARNEEHAIKVGHIHLLVQNFTCYMIIEVDTTSCGEGRVGEAVVVDKLASMSLEGRQIKVVRRGVAGVQLVCQYDCIISEVIIIPLRSELH